MKKIDKFYLWYIPFSLVIVILLIWFSYKDAEALESQEQTTQQEEVTEQITVDDSTERYVITYRISPESHSISFKDMIKADDSDFTWKVYVDKIAFDSCEIGDNTHINESYMDYDITVINKAIE